MKYVFDTSGFIEAWQRHYPPISFQGIWDRMSGLIDEDELKSPIEVRRELEHKDDALVKWAKEQNGLFEPDTYELQDAVSSIMAEFPKLVDERTGKSNADPFVIGLAAVGSATVVTYEDGGSARRPKIPYICNTLTVDCITFAQMVQNERWKLT